MVPDERGGTRLTADAWRRIGEVLDRLHDALPERREQALAEACREHGLPVDVVRPFAVATDGSEALPEEIPFELIEDAFLDGAQDPPSFRLGPGDKLGPYEIADSLGAGGMGEVYRAKDSRLGRTVAIKVLRPHLLQSVEARQRFDREARAISSLNHPYVCTLHDVGHHDGIDYLVMEYVEGETLEQRLRRGAIPIDQAIAFGAQIADALHRAHRHGIVHRDLKPANIILTRDGIKLLDFGLARVDTADVGDDRAVIGTLQYMAPEQLERRHPDARSDIFACGAVLYEMVTRTRPFGGATQADVIAGILHTQPAPVTQLVPDAPASLQWTISRCLAKDPDDRWQSAADLKHHLEWLAVGPDAPEPRARYSHIVLWSAVAVAVAAVVFGTWAWRQRAGPPARAVSIFPIYPPPGTTFDLTHAISPDGRRIAFTAVPAEGARELWVRSLDSLAPQRISGTEGAAHPFWSPDGRSVGFFADRKLKRADLASGNIHVVCDIAGAGGGASWNQDSVIVFSAAMGQDTGLWRVQASGGSPAVLTRTEQGRRDGWPRFLPDGRRFLYMRAGPGEQGVFARTLDAVAGGRILPASSAAPTKAILADDVLFFLQGGTLMAQRFDAGRLAPLGEPVRVAENVRWGPPGTAAFDAAASGIVAYRQPMPARLAQLTWLDGAGTTIARVGTPAPTVSVAIAPDGKSALVDQWSDRGRPASGTVRRIDLATGADTSLFTDAASPIWAPDGTRVVFTQFSLGLGGPPTPTLAMVNGRVPPRAIADFGRQAHATHWSRDGRFIVGSAAHSDTTWDIWIADADGREPLRYLAREPFQQRDARISPDGRWVAYASSDARGAWDVYVRSFPDGTQLRRVSTRGGRAPRWRPDGSELHFVEPAGRLMRVRINTKREFSSSAPELVFQHEALRDPLEGAGFGYDIAPDGRFLVAVPTPDTAPAAPIVVMLNWTFPGAR
jgi:serine/threonine protein kinase/Tol biopolymer transport system component